MAETRNTFVIVGGGVAGPVAALRLAKDGHKCTIYERAARPTTIGGSINIAPSGMRLLHRLGVGDEVQARGLLVPHVVAKDESGALLGQFKNESRDGSQGIRIMRSILQDIFLTEGRRRGLNVVYGKNVDHVEETEDGVAAHFADGDVAHGDFLIRADGIRSKVRDFVSARTKPQHTGMALVYGILPSKDLPGVNFAAMPPTCGVFARAGFFAMAFTDQTREEMYWIAAKRKEAAEKTEDIQQIREEEYRCFGHLYDPIPRIIASSKDFFLWPVYELPELASWHKGRVVLVGDAAHALPPNGGQGVSQAIEDVFMLARVLSREKGFADYEELRKPRIAKLRASIRGEQRERGRGPWEQWLLTWVYWAFLKLAAVSASLLGWDRFEYDPDKVEV